jgi:hypothetical protein
MEEELPKLYRIEEINRLNGFFTLYAVPWALIGLLNIEIKSRQLTGFLFAFAFLVNLLLFIYFSGKLAKIEQEDELTPQQMLHIKEVNRSLNRMHLIVGGVAGLVLIFFILILKQPVMLTPLFLILTGFLFVLHRWYYQIQGERWIAPVFFGMALILIILGDQYINWYSWGGFSGATILWYACLDRHRTVHTWLETRGVEIADGQNTEQQSDDVQ